MSTNSVPRTDGPPCRFTKLYGCLFVPQETGQEQDDPVRRADGVPARDGPGADRLAVLHQVGDHRDIQRDDEARHEGGRDPRHALQGAGKPLFDLGLNKIRICVQTRAVSDPIPEESCF